MRVARGYAAISMDTDGYLSNEFPNTNRVPRGWRGFTQTDQPVQDQWSYHAVADVILANSLIRSFPQVDPIKVGITETSRSGYLACIAAGLDHRFQFAEPVYGSVFLGDHCLMEV